jgi:hypothetical protein
VLDGGDILEALLCSLSGMNQALPRHAPTHTPKIQTSHTQRTPHLVDEPLQGRLQLGDARVELGEVAVELPVVVVQEVVPLAAEVLYVCFCLFDTRVCMFNYGVYIRGPQNASYVP